MARTFGIGPAARKKIAWIMKNDPDGLGPIMARIQSIREGAMPVPVDCNEYPVDVLGSKYKLIVVACKDHKAKVIDVEVTDIV